MTHWQTVQTRLREDPTFRHATAVRFWRKVDCSGDGCWEWQTCVNSNGYGAFGVLGAQVYAHRIALQLSGVDVPVHMCTLHSCDNRRCCRPSHLRVGTDAENIADRDSRGRHGSITMPGYHERGEQAHGSKLTESEARRVKFGDLSKCSTRLAGLELGVHGSQISRVRTGRSWAHLEDNAGS
jgi:hypothetical protein